MRKNYNKRGISMAIIKRTKNSVIFNKNSTDKELLEVVDIINEITGTKIIKTGDEIYDRINPITPIYNLEKLKERLKEHKGNIISIEYDSEQRIIYRGSK